MNVADIIKGIKAGKYSGEFKMLYKDANMPKQRYSELCSRFAEKYGQINADLFSAPGRTELGGNHTDHEHGRVLAAAVSDDIIACVSKTGDNRIIVKSAGYSEEIKDISQLEVRAEESGKSASLIRGICAGFKARGYNIGGFCAYTLSDIPKGCGLSSSAAFEVLISTVINTYFNGGAADASEIAAISQFAENRYFGKPCGLLDQTACAEGGTVFIDFKNPEKPIVEKINFDFEKTGYTVFTVNTGGSHSGLTADYAAITEDCRAVSRALGCEYLRDADSELFYENISKIRKKCSDRAVLRAMHIFDEDKRAEDERNALVNGDFKQYLRLVNESGESSQNLLQNLYSVSNPTKQEIPLALAIAKKIIGSEGAARVHGGGFAGTVQCYVKNEKCDEFVYKTEQVFGGGSCKKIKIRPCGGVMLKGD